MQYSSGSDVPKFLVQFQLVGAHFGFQTNTVTGEKHAKFPSATANAKVAVVRRCQVACELSWEAYGVGTNLKNKLIQC